MRDDFGCLEPGTIYVRSNELALSAVVPTFRKLNECAKCGINRLVVRKMGGDVRRKQNEICSFVISLRMFASYTRTHRGEIIFAP